MRRIPALSGTVTVLEARPGPATASHLACAVHMQSNMMRTVSDLMTQSVETLSPDDSLATALDVFKSRQIRHLPVIERGEVLGLLTERDLLRHMLAETAIEDQRGYLSAMKVGDVMVVGPRSVAPQTSLRTAARMMRLFKYGCVPVVEEGALVGILTEADFLKDYLE